MFSLTKGAQHGLTIIECDLIFHAVVFARSIYSSNVSKTQILLPS